MVPEHDRERAEREAGAVHQAPEAREAPEAQKVEPPRVRVVRGSPWRIDPGRRAKWSAERFVAENAVQIRQIGDPVLHAPARRPRLSRAELEALAARLFASMLAARGVGIAAPQIGVPLRVAVVDVDDVGLVLVNPEVELTSDEVEEMSEGCLSVRGLYAMLERPIAARLAAQDLAGKRFVVEGEELGAQCLLHEADHLNGVLYVDHLRSRADLRPVEPDEPTEPRPASHTAPVAGAAPSS